MITGGMEREYEYLIELLACALHGKHAENRLDQVDAEKLSGQRCFTVWRRWLLTQSGHGWTRMRSLLEVEGSFSDECDR